MTTPYRGYTEIPGNAVPDVPYRVNLALREIDADINDEAAKAATVETRVKGLETLAQIGPGDITDASMTAVALAADSEFSAAEGARIAAALAADKLDPLAPWKNAIKDQKNAAAVWVSLGSSTANGGNPTTPARAWGNRTAALLGPRPVLTNLATAAPANGVQVYNGAVAGTTSVTYLTNAKRDQVLALRPQLVTHMVGSNDYANGIDPAAYKTTIRSRVMQIRDGSDAVQVLIHQQPRLDIAAPAYPWAAYGEALKAIAAEFPTDVVFLNIGEKFDAMGLTNPYSGLYDTDNIHFKDDGNKILADLIGAFLGIPPAYTGKTVIRGTALKSGSMVLNDNFVVLKIPARPYLQRVTTHASIFSGADSGTPDWSIASTADGTETGTSTTLAVRVGPNRTTYTGIHTDTIAPHKEGEIKVFAANNGGALYMTGTASYYSVYAAVEPV